MRILALNQASGNCFRRVGYTQPSPRNANPRIHRAPLRSVKQTLILTGHYPIGTREQCTTATTSYSGQRKHALKHRTLPPMRVSDYLLILDMPPSSRTRD